MGVDGGMAEIGVHHGRLFIGMHLLRRVPERSLAIDLFAEQERNVDGSGLGNEAIFLRNLRRHAGSQADVIVKSGDSTTLDGPEVVALLGGPVRIFSVDGGHTAKIVEHDMVTAQDALSKGGVVVADDFFNEQWPGVCEGTLRFLGKNPEIFPFAVGFNKVFFTTADHLDAYRETVAKLADAKRLDHKTSELFGHPVEIIFGDRLLRRNLKRLTVVPGLLPLYRHLRRS